MPSASFKVCIVVMNTREINAEHLLESIARACEIDPARLVEDGAIISTVDNSKDNVRDLRREAFFNSLPPQKQNVVYGVACGFGNKQIAQSLEIAQGVVAEHLTEIYQRLEAFEHSHGNFPQTVSRYYLIQFFGDYFNSRTMD